MSIGLATFCVLAGLFVVNGIRALLTTGDENRLSAYATALISFAAAVGAIWVAYYIFAF